MCYWFRMVPPVCNANGAVSHSPRLPVLGLPWERIGGDDNPKGGCGEPAGHPWGIGNGPLLATNPLGLTVWAIFPGLPADGQPWAICHNAVGVPNRKKPHRVPDDLGKIWRKRLSLSMRMTTMVAARLIRIARFCRCLIHMFMYCA
jgi:hypothetical protein